MRIISPAPLRPRTIYLAIYIYIIYIYLSIYLAICPAPLRPHTAPSRRVEERVCLVRHHFKLYGYEDPTC